MMKKGLLILLCLPLIGFGQVKPELELEIVKKQFLIVASTKDYLSALRTAETISNDLKLKLDSRGIEFKPSLASWHGLTLTSSSSCKKKGIDFPCYIARGVYDDGTVEKRIIIE